MGGQQSGDYLRAEAQSAASQFWSMLSDILRFNRESVSWLASHPGNKRSLRDFLQEGRYSAAFTDWYLLPMAAAIWSCPTGQMLDTPLATFVRFCQNHGLLQVLTGQCGARSRAAVASTCRRLPRNLTTFAWLARCVRVTREAGGLRVTHAAGSEHFDQVVMACHSDQSLAILGYSASDAQRVVLSDIRYQPNRAVLHTDRALLPRDEKLWSAWNYAAGSGEPGAQPVAFPT
jgi:predicted NAD/FAD-binding protein